MHLLATTSTSLDEIVEAVDLGQSPGEIVVLSFADSDLAGVAADNVLEPQQAVCDRRGAVGEDVREARWISK